MLSMPTLPGAMPTVTQLVLLNYTGALPSLPAIQRLEFSFSHQTEATLLGLPPLCTHLCVDYVSVPMVDAVARGEWSQLCSMHLRQKQGIVVCECVCMHKCVC